FGATLPVSAIENPTLIGSAAQAVAAVPKTAASNVAASRRIAPLIFSNMASSQILSLETQLLHHFLRRHRPPQITSRWILGPDLRPLRIVAMPWMRLEIAERLVLHLIEFGK